MTDKVPLSRLAGRATGRWWLRHGDDVKRHSLPARRGWAALMGYLWIIAYCWVGVLLAVGVRNLTAAEGPWTFLAGVGGGSLIGIWQARHRMDRHLDPTTPPLRWFGVALCAWLAAIGLAALL